MTETRRFADLNSVYGDTPSQLVDDKRRCIKIGDKIDIMNL